VYAEAAPERNIAVHAKHVLNLCISLPLIAEFKIDKGGEYLPKQSSRDHKLPNGAARPTRRRKNKWRSGLKGYTGNPATPMVRRPEIMRLRLSEGFALSRNYVNELRAAVQKSSTADKPSLRCDYVHALKIARTASPDEATRTRLSRAAAALPMC
jgi:hypothetical protein